MSSGLARFVVESVRVVVFSVLWSAVLFNVGRLALLTGTLERYPRGRALDQHVDRISAAVALVPVVTWVAIAACHSVSPHALI